MAVRCDVGYLMMIGPGVDEGWLLMKPWVELVKVGDGE